MEPGQLTVSLGNYQLLWKDLWNNHSDPDFPHDINHTLVRMQCADARRKKYVDYDNQKPQPCSGGWRWLLPPTVSELSQYVLDKQLSPEEHHYPDERERETVNCEVQHWQVSVVSGIETRH